MVLIICYLSTKRLQFLHFLCFDIFNTTPISLIKTISEVEPAEINGSGIPVGGIEPDMTC